MDANFVVGISLAEKYNKLRDFYYISSENDNMKIKILFQDGPVK